MGEIGDIVIERERELIDEVESEGEVDAIGLSEQDVRDFSGIFKYLNGESNVNIEALEANANHFRLRALNESDPVKESFYKSAEKACYLKADQLRMREGLRPEHEEAISIVNDEIENNDLTRLEKFKIWAKENMLGLSVVAITIAGIITTIAVTARGAVKAGAAAVGAFGKMLAKVAKSLGPLLAPLLGVIANIISWGAKGILWLSQNLWVLVIAATYFAYDYWEEKKYEYIINE